MRHATKILVTGARLPVALELVRAFRELGCEVWAGDSICLTPAGASRCAAGRVRFPSPVFNRAGFQEKISAEVERLGIQLVVPASEEIFFLAAFSEKLLPARLLAPPLALLRELHSKWGVLSLADACGIRLPRTQRVVNGSELAAALAKFPRSLLKPEFSRGSYELIRPESGALLPIPSASRPWLVQEWLEGRELSTCSVLSEGRLLAHTSYEPRYRAGPGASLYFEPVHSPSSEQFVAAFAAKHSLSGLLSFDFMENVDGSLVLLECNPRPTSGAHLLPAGWAAALLAGGSAVSSAEKLPRPRAAMAAVLALHLWPALLTGRLFAFARDWWRARDSCFRWSDPAPAAVLNFSAAEIFLRALVQWRVRPKLAYTYDLEWNGEEA